MSQYRRPSGAEVDAINRAIELQSAGRTREAENIYRQVLPNCPAVPEVYANLALICAGSQRQAEALKLWGQALTIDPDHLPALVHLGMALKQRGALDQAELCYRRALELNPEMAEVAYNLANLYQQSGDGDAAEHWYRHALSQQPDLSLAHYNLGNLARDRGRLDEAQSHYRSAIEKDPTNPLFHNNLGNVFMQRDAISDAAACYRRAIELQPGYPDALYNLGHALTLVGELAAAADLFSRADIRDSAARSLYCGYRAGDDQAFVRQLQTCLTQPHRSPQVASLSAHHAWNTGGEDAYRFCPGALDFIYQDSLPDLAGEASPEREALLATIAAVDMDRRHQGRLHHGEQSSGHLFRRDEPPLRALAEQIRAHFDRYRQRFANRPCELIAQFPERYEFESAWFINMHRGGHLDAHIHETGWLSGVVYLALPEGANEAGEGAIEFSLHGDNLPRRRQDFPTRRLSIRVGDIVLFPSSLFHRTLPFRADQPRICIAFDLSPAR